MVFQPLSLLNFVTEATEKIIQMEILELKINGQNQELNT
jgi:hypothetical protein